ncbi:Gfo/Idh/MocA family oxidoreductase [Salinisphaera sp.]|uniref:Gfo/Idh/MocA family protein n=1 Tax=Salinisphaera sp. TaxID=1914330 RepID=UPI002D799749|nr:Gfo/Idh/MocA family oxidoreductase [Salinisphaera sp.]HET7313300.1 Gfo/Idh/MocA family oxidoreductase [Salinisphaera sp.]
MNGEKKESVLSGALIGCGFFARNQMQAWRDLPGANIVAVCDRVPANVARFRQDFDIAEGFTDIEALFNSCDLDFVDIAAPTPAHAELVEAAARHGVDVICQKPFAGPLDMARDLIVQCEQSGISLTIHENFRWQSAIREVVRLVADGAIGEPFFGRVSYRSGFDVFANQPYLAELPRFIIQDLGIHVLDIARALFGDVARLSCETARITPNINGEDTATIMLRHDRGTTCVVDCSYASVLADDPFPQSLIEIDGDRGSIRLKQDFSLELHRPGEAKECRDVTPESPSWSEQPWAVIQESVVNLQRDWLECRRAGRPAATHGADNFNTLGLVEAAYRSAETGRTVVPERWQ